MTQVVWTGLMPARIWIGLRGSHTLPGVNFRILSFGRGRYQQNCQHFSTNALTCVTPPLCVVAVDFRGRPAKFPRKTEDELVDSDLRLQSRSSCWAAYSV